MNAEEYKVRSEELQKASLPLLEFLNKYYDPHTIAIVTEGNVEILIGEMTATLPVRD
jgi:hypothetical protein